MKRRKRVAFRNGIAMAAIAAALTCAPLASGTELRYEGAPDDEGPLVVGELKKYETFYLEPPSTALNLVSSYSHDREKSSANPRRTAEFSESLFQQSIEANTQGYFIHPNFAELTLGGTLGVNEVFQDVDGDSSQSFNEAYTWDAKSIFLRNGEAPITLYSQRNESWINREFGPTIQSTSTTSGAAIDFKKTSVPTHLEYSHSDSQQNDVSGGEDFNYTRDAFSWFSSAQPSPNHSITWNYNFDSVQQSGQGSESNFDTHTANLTDQINFGPKGRSSLITSGNFQKQSGSVEDQQFRFDQRLRIEHSDTLSSRLQYTYSDYSYPDSDQHSHRVLAGFTHKLYDSLTTNGNAGIQKTDFSGGGDTLYKFADIEFDYRKIVPKGNLSAGLGLAWSQADSSSTSTTTNLNNRPFTFTDPQPITIVGTNPTLRALTDPSGLILYRPGIDYTVSTFSDRLEINRLVGGLIPDGQTVLADYSLGPVPANTTDTYSLSTSLRYDINEGPLNGLGVFGRFNVSNQSISSSDASAFVANDFEDTTLGADYRIASWVFGYEHEWYDSSINPFDADRLYARYSRRVDYDTTLSLNAAYTDIDYDEPTDHVELFTISGQVTRNIGRELTATFTALYRDEHQDTTGDVTGFEQQLELNWRHRQTEVFLIFRNALLDTDTQDSSFQFVQLGVRREF